MRKYVEVDRIQNDQKKKMKVPDFNSFQIITDPPFLNVKYKHQQNPYYIRSIKLHWSGVLDQFSNSGKNCSNSESQDNRDQYDGILEWCHKSIYNHSKLVFLTSS